MFSLTQFLAYVIVVDFTPGPNTIAACANGVRFGFRRTVPFILGLLCGQTVIVVVAALFSRALFEYLPSVKPIMLAMGAAYMLYLAYKVWRSGGVQADTSQQKDAPISFVSAVLLQFINPKFLFFVLTALSNYILPHFDTLPAIAAKAMILPLGGLSSVTLWTLFGSLFCNFYNRHAKAVNLVLALTLVYCAVALFL